MIILAISLLIFLLVLFLLSSKNNKYDTRELKELERKIFQKRTELDSIEQELHNKRIDRTNNFTIVVNEVLNIYEESNIKIPLDIIEELQFMNFSNEKQVFEYIENQRNHWKLENNKKPYRKVWNKWLNTISYRS